jgi:hypothetical protein
MAPKRRAAAAKPPPEAFTPERFEQELKDLAAKAKDETWGKNVKEHASVYLKSAALLTLCGVYSNVSQMALSPVYGSIPSSIWHSKLVMAACFVGWSANLALQRQLRANPAHLLPLIAIYIPTVQFYLYKLSGTLTAHWGPLATEALTLFPLMALSVSCVATYLENAELPIGFPKWIADAAPGLGSWSFFKLIEALSGSYLNTYVGKTFFHTRVGLELVLAASYTAFSPSKFLLYAIPALLHTAVFNTHVFTPIAFGSLNATLSRDNWMLLDRKESLTGYISVLENLDQGFRVMRCDHSLLGGEWVRFKGLKVAEPIYGVFAMLEAVRLVEVSKSVPDIEARALIM